MQNISPGRLFITTVAVCGALAGALVMGNRLRSEVVPITPASPWLPSDTAPKTSLAHPIYIEPKIAASESGWYASESASNLQPLLPTIRNEVMPDGEENNPHLASLPEFVRREYQSGEFGVTYAKLFDAYLQGSTYIEVTEPYLFSLTECEDFSEFLELVVKHASRNNRVRVHLITKEAPRNAMDAQVYKSDKIAWLCSLKRIVRNQGVDLTWELRREVHDRKIVTDLGTQVRIDMGLHVWGWNSHHAGERAPQKKRACQAFGYQAYRGVTPARPATSRPQLDDYGRAA